MNQQVVMVDQFTIAMTSIQEALANLRQEIGIVRTTVIEDTHARMDRIEQRIIQLRVSDSSTAWDDLEDIPVASLPIKFRMPEIKRPFADFSALVLALYDVEDVISGRLWIDSSIVDAKGKKPSGEHRSAEVALMWALSLLLVRGLPGVISQYHSLLGLTLLIIFNSIGHEHLLSYMIRPTCLPY
ncbi:hypothetical protein CK203_068716 [Vitis vinifera]|uniref:Uncharacterized protein n=1 Tax=Vitis vinifera TaxID=29760 RepID=A0A438EE72_VITVI|nr:hypothetical protein CK203_068716 [Vitis vinifera]